MRLNRKIPRHRRFAFRLALSYGIVFVAAFFFAGFLITHYFEKQILHQAEKTLLVQSRLFAQMLPASFDSEQNSERFQELVSRPPLEGFSRLTVIDLDGRIVADSKNSGLKFDTQQVQVARAEVFKVLSGKSPFEIVYSRNAASDLLFAVSPVAADERITGAVRLELQLREVRLEIQRMTRYVGAALSGVAAAVLLLGFWLGEKLSFRISQLAKAAANYAQGSFSEKILIDGRDEIKSLADSLNKIAHSSWVRANDFEAGQANLRTILASMSEGVIAVDRRNQTLLANSSAEEMFGVAPGTAAGKSLLELTKKTQLEELVRQAVREKRRIVQEIEITRASARVLNANAVAAETESAEVAGILVLSDMTKIRRLENLRREFVANVSHELKTPLTSIRGFIETLLSGALEDTKTSERFLKLMDEDARRLDRLILDLLEISRLEDRQAELHFQEVDLAEEADYALVRLQSRMDEKRIRVENRMNPGKLPKVKADRDKIRQVFLNLIDNAIKFNNTEGTILLEGVIEKDSVRVIVQDSGIGIPEESVNRVFERFFRVDKARSREMGGTGLGLSIVKHILEVHNSAITCESSLGKGTRFSFSLRY